MMTEGKFNYNIGLLKIISCIAVMGLHSIARSYSLFDKYLYLLCGFAVPMFFMISGYLQGNKIISHKASPLKMLNLLGIIVVWNGIVCIIDPILFPNGVSFTWGGILIVL